jgi:hypothetical protein
LRFELKKRSFHLAKSDTGEVAVAAPVGSFGGLIVVSALILVLLWGRGALVAQPVRLARLSVARLDKRSTPQSGSVDETGQETQSPEGSFKSHYRVRIQPFPPRDKPFMSVKLSGINVSRR